MNAENSIYQNDEISNYSGPSMLKKLPDIKMHSKDALK